MNIRSLSVSEVNSYIKKVLHNDAILYNLKLKGEISNLKIHSSNNVYLTLKDDKSKISCIIFKDKYDKSLELKNGMNVVASGYVSVYERDGSYQFYIDKVEVEGLGNLYIEFNKLKLKLNNEGLFDQKYKKTIPKMPSSIGIITSQTGSVIRDIINVISRRYPKVNLRLFQASVQGEKSVNDVCRGIEFFNKNNNVDVIIIARGGGSIEELWSFNEEKVARAIFESKIPIISAIGHETDFTICDFVSDMRAPTPSAAAEIATPLLSDMIYRLDNIKNKLDKSLNNTVKIKSQELDYTYNNILRYVSDYIIKDKVIQLDIIYDKIVSEAKNNIDKKEKNLHMLGTSLNNLSPLNVIERGYCVVEKDEKMISSIDDLEKDDVIDIILKDGNVNCKINEIFSK